MTEKLYYIDAYIKEFSATVLSCEATSLGFEILLDKTAFFPEEGGQYADRGYIGEARVSDARETDGLIYHLADAPIEVGRTVLCRLDFEERYEKMQCHTAEHILSGIINKRHGLDNVGFHLGENYVTMDLSGVLTREELDEIEREANEAAFANVEVTAYFPSFEELPRLNYRAKLDISENVRIVNIGEYDACACCAPHVARTGECGLIKILDFEKLRGGLRLFITAGRRALLGYRELFSSATEISRLLSVPKTEIADGVRKLLSDLEAERSAFKNYRLSLIRERAAELEERDGNAVVTLDGASTEELRIFASEAVSRVSGMLVALSPDGASVRYAIASNTLDTRPVIKEANKALSGRGGGSASLVQGSFAADTEQIKAYFADK